MTWQQILQQNFRDWRKLADFLELSPSQKQTILEVSHFPLNLPLRIAGKIRKQDLEDPLLKQFLPVKEETLLSKEFVLNPMAEDSFRKEAKLLHKYEGRALLVCTSVCAMHCRYCFRQNFAYDTVDKSFSQELALIREDPSLHEIILSGGDPLSLSDSRLQGLLVELSSIPHITRIRFHTRFPIGIPERITDAFVTLLQSLPQKIWFVIHVNHPRELDEDICRKIRELQKIGVIVLNQSVLLKGVNDNVETLKELCEELVNYGVLPYYLHQLDRVQGAAHFEVDEKKGQQLIQALAAQLPGYAVPKYVREIPGEPNKTALA